MFGDLSLRSVPGSESPLFTGFEQRWHDQRGDRQMPGVHRTQRVPTNELEGVFFHLFLRRTQNDDRPGKVGVQRCQESLFVGAAGAGRTHKSTGNLDPGPGTGHGGNVGIGKQGGCLLMTVLVRQIGPRQD